MLPSRPESFWQLQPHPKNLVNQCCYFSSTTRAFIFFRRKTQSENDFKKMQSSFQIWGYVRHFFLRVTRALGTFCGSRTSSISNPPSSECGGIPSSPYIGVRACVCARSCAYLCAGKRKKNGVDADSAGREVLHEHAVVVAMLIIFTESLFLFIYYCLPFLYL